MKKILRIFIVTTVLFPSLIFAQIIPTGRAEATDFNIDIALTYTVKSEGIMHISEYRTIKNNSKQFYIKKGSTETFIITPFKIRTDISPEELNKVAQTVVVNDQSGNTQQASVDIKESHIEVAVTLDSDIHQSQQKALVLEYDNFELAEKSGNIWNVYVPGISSKYSEIQTDQNGATTATSYSILLEIDNTLGKPNFVLPEPRESVLRDGKVQYYFNTEDLVEKSAWIQIGNKQYYSFNLTQHVTPSSSASSKIFNTWYEVLLPRESENQKVYIETITPEPEYIRKDDEGNIVARFAFTSDQTSAINIKGYIVTSITQEITEAEVGNVSDIDLTKPYAEIEGEERTFADIVSPQQYWEVQAPEIQDTAKGLKDDKTNVYEILLSDYTFVTDHVDYDNLKVELLNERKGALSTLKGGSSVCMEYSDLLITLLRAQGIPARAAFGYGFDPRSESNDQEGHQWVELYMPNIGWVAVDPTWGDTGRKNYIGGDVDHALWYVAGLSVNTPSPVVKYAVWELGSIEPPEFMVDVVDNSVDLEQLSTLDELLSRYQYSQTDKLQEKISQLNVYGKVVFLGIPGLLLISVIIIIIVSISRHFSKKRRETFVQTGPASHDVPDNPYYEP